MIIVVVEEFFYLVMVEWFEGVFWVFGGWGGIEGEFLSWWMEGGISNGVWLVFVFRGLLFLSKFDIWVIDFIMFVWCCGFFFFKIRLDVVGDCCIFRYCGVDSGFG